MFGMIGRLGGRSLMMMQFSTKNFIGRGGFGLVFKGILSDGSVVAVKRILESDFQGDVEFCNEVKIISNLKQRNLVPLQGCCVVDDDDEKFNDRGSQRFLVYDYMLNGNLEDHLFLVSEQQKLKKSLTWPQRKSIILDVAKGLAYLSCDACVHGDVFIVQIHIRVSGTNGTS
ncbi:hypothetical protein HN51_069883 [Arachis hypogaea]